MIGRSFISRSRPGRAALARRAFSLMELMVIAGVLGVLIALLVPSLARVKSAARRTLCLTNARAMGSAAVTFAAGHNNLLPAMGGGAVQLGDGDTQPNEGINLDAGHGDGVNGGTGGNLPLQEYNGYYKLIKGNYLAVSGGGDGFYCPDQPADMVATTTPSHYAVTFSVDWDRSGGWDITRSARIDQFASGAKCVLVNEVGVSRGGDAGWYTGPSPWYAGLRAGQTAEFMGHAMPGRARAQSFAFADGHADHVVAFGGNQALSGCAETADSEVKQKIYGRNPAGSDPAVLSGKFVWNWKARPDAQ